VAGGNGSTHQVDLIWQVAFSSHEEYLIWQVRQRRHHVRRLPAAWPTASPTLVQIWRPHPPLCKFGNRTHPSPNMATALTLLRSSQLEAASAAPSPRCSPTLASCPAWGPAAASCTGSLPSSPPCNRRCPSFWSSCSPLPGVAIPSVVGLSSKRGGDKHGGQARHCAGHYQQVMLGREPGRRLAKPIRAQSTL
jgi:hypothetical protein